MKRYMAVVSAQFRSQLQYRAAALAGMGTQLFFGFMFVMIYEAWYRSSTSPLPLTEAQVVTYVWLGQALMMLLPWVDDGELRRAIRTGAVVYELQKPIDLYNFWFVRAMAKRVASAMLRSVPLAILAGLFFEMQLPVSVSAAAMFAIALVGVVLLSCAILSLYYISMLWTITSDGINSLVQPALFLFSGATLPLPFFPQWAQGVINILPFRGLADTPYRLYLGIIPPSDALFYLAHQLAWTLALVVLGRWLLSRGLRRLVVQGG